MAGNIFNKAINVFFSGFQKLVDFLGEKLTCFIFTILPFFYFSYFLISNIWYLYSTDEPFNTDETISQTIKNILVGLIGVLSFAVRFYFYLKRISDIDLKILQFSRKFYSEETTKLCFEPLIADWKNEYSEAISQNMNWKARWISVRYAHAFLWAIFMQSWFGRLFEIIWKNK